MDSLREIVDVFGGIEVYVPVTMEYDGSRLEQGWRVLMGAECEFFLRQRKEDVYKRQSPSRRRGCARSRTSARRWDVRSPA